MTATKEKTPIAAGMKDRRDKLIAELEQIDEQKKLADSVPKKTRQELIAALRELLGDYVKKEAVQRKIINDADVEIANRAETRKANAIRELGRIAIITKEKKVDVVAQLEAVTPGFVELKNELEAASTRLRNEEMSSRSDIPRCSVLHEKVAAMDQVGVQLRSDREVSTVSTVLLSPDPESKLRDLRRQFLEDVQ